MRDEDGSFLPMPVGKRAPDCGFTSTLQLNKDEKEQVVTRDSLSNGQ